jgi:uncharacterized protein
VEASGVIPELACARYESWDALLATIRARVDRRLNLLLDEFPYLVASLPELPSLIQRYLDQPGPRKLGFLLYGSSQRMMQGLVLHRSKPLYGRAWEILKIDPLPPRRQYRGRWLLVHRRAAMAKAGARRTRAPVRARR